MNLIIYPYLRIITKDYLCKNNYPEQLIEDMLEGLNYSYHYEAGFPQNNLIKTGLKNRSIEDLLEIINTGLTKKPIKQAKKISIVRNSLKYQEMFRPSGAIIGEIEEISEEDYQTFVKGILEIKKKI